MEYKRILVLAPHTDDAELGCGGSIARFVEEGCELSVVVFSSAEESVPEGAPPDTLKQEFLRAIPELGVLPNNAFVYDYPVRRLSYYRQEILEEMVKLRRKINPDMVFLPSCQDVHQDHQVIHIEGLRAFKDVSILGYELPWNHITFSAQAFIRLEQCHIEKKWKAMQAYESQLRLARSYFSKEFVEGLARVRGTQIKVQYAEAFDIVRVNI